MSFRYRPDIDGLRAIAVLAVLVYHAFPLALPGGFVGVDVFFIISGYLISGLILEGVKRGEFTFADFYVRRARRIFPALLLVLCACLIVGWWLMNPPEYLGLARLSGASSLFLANFELWHEMDYFDLNSKVKPLLHIWSLGVEEQFYIIWPALLLLLSRRRAWLIPGIAVLALASFVLNIDLIGSDPTATFYLPFTRFWELLLGAALAARDGQHIPNNGPAPATGAGPASQGASLLGLALIIAACLLLRPDSTFPGWWALLPALGTVLHIMAGPDAWANRRLTAQPVLVFIGLISYPLYLWHWPPLAFLQLVELDWSVNAIRLLKLGLLLASGLLAYLTYRFLERPVRRAPGRRYVGPLAAAMVIVLLLAVAVVLERGVPSRLGVAQTEIWRIVDMMDAGIVPNYRESICQMKSNQSHTNYAAQCFAPDRAPGNNDGVLLWGDSHAGHLYPGIRHRLEGTTLGLTQLSNAGCPPIVAYVMPGRPHCTDENSFVLEWARVHHPRVVIIAGDWPIYHNYQDVERTVAALEDMRIRHIVLVGPVPSFRVLQPKLVSRAVRDEHVSERLTNSLYPQLREIDATLHAIASRHGAEFVSPLALECDGDRCLVALDGQASKLMAWDESHLTLVGSQYVVDHLLAPYLVP